MLDSYYITAASYSLPLPCASSAPGTTTPSSQTTNQNARVVSAAQNTFIDPNAVTQQQPSAAQELLKLIPENQRTVNALPRCVKLMEGIDKKSQKKILRIINDNLLDNHRAGFIKAIEPLAGIRGDQRLLAIVLVLQVDPLEWGNCVSWLTRVDFQAFSLKFNQELSYLSSEKRDLILRIVLPKLWGLDAAEWTTILKLAGSLSHLRVREEESDGWVSLQSCLADSIALLLNSTTPSVRANSVALFNLIPKDQRNVTSLKSCIVFSETKCVSIDAMLSLAGSKGELPFGIIALVREFPDVLKKLKELSVKEEENLSAAVEFFPEYTRSHSLQELAPVLQRADISDWPHILKIAAVLLPPEKSRDWNLLAEGISLLQEFPQEKRAAVVELMHRAPSESLRDTIKAAKSIPRTKKDAIFPEMMPLLCDVRNLSDLNSALQFAGALSHHEVEEQEGEGWNPITEVVALLHDVEDISARESSIALFMLLPERQRNNAHLKLCIKMASNQDREVIVAAFKRIPEARRGVALEMIASRLNLMRGIPVDNFMEVVANFPMGEEGEICDVLEQAIPMLHEVRDVDVLTYSIRLFGLLSRDQRDLKHLEICIDLLSDIPEERILLAKASAKDSVAAINSVPLRERGTLFQWISSLRRVPERRVRANILGLFTLLPEVQRTEESLEMCVALMQGSYPMEGKGIVAEMKRLSVEERIRFLKIGDSKLKSEGSVWFKKDVITLFGSFTEEEREEVSLQHCVTLLSGSAKCFERDLIVEAVKKLPEGRRATFVRNFAELFQIENMLERAHKVQRLVL